MFWNRIMPDGPPTLDAEPNAFLRGGRRLAEKLPTPEEVKLDVQMAMMASQHAQRRERLKRKALYLKAAALALTYIGGVAVIWAVIRLLG